MKRPQRAKFPWILQKRRTLPAFNELDPYLLLNYIIYDYANLQLLSPALKKLKQRRKFPI